MAIKRTPASSANNKQATLKLIKNLTETTPATIEKMVTNMKDDLEQILTGVNLAKEDMSLGLEAFEFEVKEKKAALEAAHQADVEKLQLEISELKLTKQSAQKEYTRELEDLTYTQAQNIERINEKAWSELAAKLKKSTLTRAEESIIKSELSKLTQDFESKVATEIDRVKLDIVRTNEMENLKKDSVQANRINDLQYQLEKVTELMETYKAQYQSADAHVKQIPTMIAEAVSATSKSVIVNTDNKK